MYMYIVYTYIDIVIIVIYIYILDVHGQFLKVMQVVSNSATSPIVDVVFRVKMAVFPDLLPTGTCCEQDQ